MRVIRACLTEAERINQNVILPPNVFQHLIKVLRLNAGATIEVFNGRGARFSGVLNEVSKKSAQITLVDALNATPESPLHTHMGLVMSKGDRFDYAIQKATELGVTTITPLLSDRCDLKLNAERAVKKIQHWQGILTSACEQSYRDTLPILYPITPLRDWVTAQNSDLQLVFHTTAASPSWSMDGPSSVAFLVGPEGGLTEAEVDFSHSNQFQSWQLGPRIMRTETAPVVILSLLQSKWGDF